MNKDESYSVAVGIMKLKLLINKIISALICIQLVIPAHAFAGAGDGTSTTAPYGIPDMPAARAAQEIGASQPALTLQEEAARAIAFKNAREEALKTFRDIPKMADSIITDAKIFRSYQEFKTPNGERFPISHVSGEFGYTMTDKEKIETIVHLDSLASSKVEKANFILFFTIQSRVNEAIEFKQQYEADINKKVVRAEDRKKVLIVVIPDRYEETLMKDSGLVKKSIWQDYIKPYLPTWNKDSEKWYKKIGLPKQVSDTFTIVKNNFTTRIDTTDKKVAFGWGVTTAIVYGITFAYQGVSPELASAMIVYGSFMSYFYNSRATKIRNIFQANILKDFRVAGDIKILELEASKTEKRILRSVGIKAPGKLTVKVPGVFRQAVEQLPLSFLTSFGGYALGESVSAIEHKVTEQQVVGNTLLSIGGTFSTMARQSLTPDAARKMLNYVMTTNILMNSLMAAGIVGLTLDLSLMEITTMSFAKLGLHVLIGIAIYKNRATFEKLMNKDLARGLGKITKSSLERLKRVVVVKASDEPKRKIEPYINAKSIEEAINEARENNPDFKPRNARIHMDRYTPIDFSVAASSSQRWPTTSSSIRSCESVFAK